MWGQYVVFTAGMLDGYKDPAQAKSKDNWGDMMKRNMETLHFGGSLKAIDEVLATIPDEAKKEEEPKKEE